MVKEVINTGTDVLIASLEANVLTIMMNRPEVKNALNSEMLSSMDTVLADAETNPEVRCVVLTGAGKGFCAGGDVKAFAAQASSSMDKSMGIDQKIHKQRLSQRLTSGRLYEMPKPTIAAISGAAAGAGLSLALACDLRIMSEDAVVTTAFAKVGLSGDYGGTFLLSQLVGQAKAREMYFLSDRIDAEGALKAGLVNWVSPFGELKSKTEQIAQRLACGPSIAYRYMKENFNRAISTGDLAQCMDLEATHHVHCFDTEDHKGAAEAFTQKRKPVFKGR